MHLNITNRVALITGASQGIGRAIAIQLAKEGARIAITSNDRTNLEHVANEIKDLGSEVIPILGDVTLEEDIKTITDEVTQYFSGIDILVNNVGSIGRIDSFDNISSDEWYSLFKLNVMSGINFTKFILPHMRKSQWGRIIFISSEKAIEPGTNMSHYAMSKAAILSIAKSLANEVGKDGITVNSVTPGVIVTPAWDQDAKKNNLNREEYASKFCHNVLTGQSIGQPEDVALLVCYLCSESARWITGSNFRVDGGSVKSMQL